MREEYKALIAPARLWSRAEVFSRPCPVPREAGIYAWYFRSVPTNIPIDACHVRDGAALLYIGISPREPPKNGARSSRQRLISRIRYHYRGNAAGSTLRLTLGCLLASTLGIELRRVGSGQRYTFAEGENLLSQWMDDHALVCWVPTESPWILESLAISELSLPLNLRGNERHAFHPKLSSLRRNQRRRADQLPIC